MSVQEPTVTSAEFFRTPAFNLLVRRRSFWLSEIYGLHSLPSRDLPVRSSSTYWEVPISI